MGQNDRARPQLGIFQATNPGNLKIPLTKDSKPALLSHDVAEKLKLRLVSAVPLISLEAGNALLKIAPLVPELVGKIALELRSHEQPWAQVSAVLPSLAAGDTIIPIDWIVHWLKKFDTYAGERRQLSNDSIASHIRALESAALPQALKRVAAELREEKAQPIIFDFLKRAPISMHVYDHIRKTLTEDPAKKWVEDAWTTMISAASRTSWEGFSLDEFLTFPDRMRDAEDVLFKCIMDACGTDESEAEPATRIKSPELSKLVGSMGFWEMGLGDILVLSHSASEPLVAVIGGIIEVLSLDKRLLGSETRLLFHENDESRRLFHAVRQDERVLPPERLATVSVDVLLLAQALDHPSELAAWNAARLLKVHTFDEAEQDVIRVEFLAARNKLNYFGMIAPQAWARKLT